MPDDGSVRILLADEQDVFRRGMRGLIGEHLSWRVVAEASSVPQAVERAAALVPDVAIIDVALQGRDEGEFVSAIRAASSATKVLVCTASGIPQVITTSLHAGTRGFLLKTDAERLIMTAIEEVAHGRSFLAAEVADIVFAGFGQLSHHRADGRGASTGDPHLAAGDRDSPSADGGQLQQDGGASLADQREDGRDAPHEHRAQARRSFRRRPRPVCDPAATGDGVAEADLRAASAAPSGRVIRPTSHFNRKRNKP